MVKRRMKMRNKLQFLKFKKGETINITVLPLPEFSEYNNQPLFKKAMRHNYPLFKEKCPFCEAGIPIKKQTNNENNPS